MAPALVAGDDGVGQRPDLALGRAGARSSTSLGADRTPAPSSSSSFSSSRSSRCWRSPTWRTSALAAPAVELEAELARARARPTSGSSQGLTVPSAAIVAAGLLDDLVRAPPGALARPSSRAKKATVGLGRRRLHAPQRPARRRRPSSARRRRRSRSGGRGQGHRRQRRGRRSGVQRRPRAPRRRPRRSPDSAIARRRARRSAMRPWSSPWMR